MRLTTIDAAKGLEFDHVIIPDVNAREFDGASGDERNLFSVAASRARYMLRFPTGKAPPVRSCG
jgi:DNA helicase-2/ATP-dependent DNA helicase PcrA